MVVCSIRQDLTNNSTLFVLNAPRQSTYTRFELMSKKQWYTGRYTGRYTGPSPTQDTGYRDRHQGYRSREQRTGTQQESTAQRPRLRRPESREPNLGIHENTGHPKDRRTREIPTHTGISRTQRTKGTKRPPQGDQGSTRSSQREPKAS